MGVDGRVAVVTGGGSGIGAGIAAALAAKGARVAVLDVDAHAATTTAARLATEGLALGADVTDPDAVEQACDQVVAHFGALDVLVNNAGIIADEADLAELPLERWQRVLAVNLTGQFLMAQRASVAMRAGGWGRIVNIASRAWLGSARLADYAASKGGVISLTRALALELGKHGITVNAVSPALVETPLFARMPEAERQEVLARVGRQPVGRPGTPADIAHAVCFFADERSGYITGQHLYVSGGAELRSSGIV